MKNSNVVEDQKKRVRQYEWLLDRLKETRRDAPDRSRLEQEFREAREKLTETEWLLLYRIEKIKKEKEAQLFQVLIMVGFFVLIIWVFK